jgi:membrane protease YdiL (CAAX protease family)
MSECAGRSETDVSCAVGRAPLAASLIVLAAFFLAQLAALCAAGAADSRDWPVWLAKNLAPPLVLLLGAVVVAWRYGPLVSGLVPSRRTVWWVVSGVGLGAAGGHLVGPTRLEGLAPWLGPTARVMWGVAWVGLGAPVIEELFFRGVLQASLARLLNAPLAVVLAAVAFGVAHLGVQPLWLWPLLGLLFGALAAVSGSLWPAVAAHAAWNLATVFSSFFSEGTGEARVAGLSLGLVCFVGATLQRSSGRQR